jgi:hypothetical protein
MHTGAEHRRRPPQWHIHGAHGRCSYGGVLPQIRTRHLYKHTGCSRAHTHEHQSQWRKAQGTGRCTRGEGWTGATAVVAQRKGRAGMA